MWKLPEIHALLISHNHYDHLDAITIRNLGNQTRYFAPIGLKRWFLNRDMDWINELNWWQSTKLDKLPIHLVPAKHFSGRNRVNVEATLWGGWVIETSKGAIYFAGDSGYFSGFEQIGAQFAPIRLAMIPIGAYRPRWFMHPIHINPEEAVKVHQEVGAQFSVGMHWGTFAMAEEPKREPPIYLGKAKEEAGLQEDGFVTMAFGESFNI